MCARSHGNPNILLLALGDNNNKSVLLRFVNSIIGRDSRTLDMIN